METRTPSSESVLMEHLAKGWEKSHPQLRLEVQKACCGVSSSRPSGVDVTKELQRYIDERFGGSMLVVPAQHATCEVFQAHAHTGRRKVRIEYRVIDQRDGTVLDHCERQFADGEAITITSSSWFTDLVLVAHMASTAHKFGRFPRRALHSGLRQLALHRSFIRLGDALTLSNSESGCALPDTGYVGPEFSLGFWIRYELPSAASASSSGDTNNNNVRRQLLYKGGPNSQNKRQLDMCLVKQEGDGETDGLRMSVSLTSNKNQNMTFCSQRPIVPNKWVLVVVCVGIEEVSMCFDGVSALGSSQSLSGGPHTNADPWYWGKLPPGVVAPNQNHTGIRARLADIRLFSRPLTLHECTAKAYGGTSPPDSPSQRYQPPSVPPLSLPAAELASVLHDFARFSAQQDGELVRLLYDQSNERKKKAAAAARQRNDSSLNIVPCAADAFCLPLQAVELPENRDKLKEYHHHFQSYSLTTFQLRFAILREFNVRLANVFPLVDFSQSHISWSLATTLFRVRGMIFTRTKSELWNNILLTTMSRSGVPNVRLNRIQYIKARDQGDPECKRSVFGQAFEQLHFVPPQQLRSHGRQSWHVDLVGESAVDAGGVFRESVTNICTDIQSLALPLFRPVPNSGSPGSPNWNMWLPNPASNSAHQLRMFAFIGKLMGVAIRGKHLLNLDIPPLIWKQLVGEPVSEHDLMAIDTIGMRTLLDQRGYTRQQFEDVGIEQNFTYSNVEGQLIELVPGGADKVVTYENRLEYVDAVVQYRLEEYALQVDAMRKGMGAIIPLQLLPLFTWKELELNVCGRAELDVDLLRRHTVYSGGVTEKDPHIQFMWQMLANFSPQEAEAFIRFVWGRARIPVDDDTWTSSRVDPFKVSPFPSRFKDDNVLPKSHTCFFQIDLPRYTSLEAMTKMVSIAMNECTDIQDDGEISVDAFTRALNADE